jgi:hypothetical protein
VAPVGLYRGHKKSRRVLPGLDWQEVGEESRIKQCIDSEP